METTLFIICPHVQHQHKFGIWVVSQSGLSRKRADKIYGVEASIIKRENIGFYNIEDQPPRTATDTLSCFLIGSNFAGPYSVTLSIRFTELRPAKPETNVIYEYKVKRTVVIPNCRWNSQVVFLRSKIHEKFRIYHEVLGRQFSQSKIANFSRTC